MNPTLSNVSENNGLYKFTLSDINVSFANALRRTILSDIPTVVIHTGGENTTDDQCTISINTGRLHNEIVKHRLSCIPIHNPELDLPGKYVLDLDVKNDTDNMMYVTTEDFRLIEKASGKYLVKEEVHKIFPSDPTTGQYIDFVRLRPKVGDNIPGEHIKLSAEFSIGIAKSNNMYNVVSKCSYGDTPDMKLVNEAWEERLAKLSSESASKPDIEFQKKNFMALDAQRYSLSNSFDFVIQTLGIFSNRELVKRACIILKKKMTDLIQSIEADEVSILNGEVTYDNCYDFILEGEDYTIGKTLEYVLYESRYLGDKSLSFCGFKKFHPHNPSSTLRLAFTQTSDKITAGLYVKQAAEQAIRVFDKIQSNF